MAQPTAAPQTPPQSTTEMIQEILWNLSVEYLPPLWKIILTPFRTAEGWVVSIVVALLLSAFPFWENIKDYGVKLKEHYFRSNVASILVPEEFASPPTHRFVWRETELLSVTSQIKNLSELHKDKQVHFYLVGGPGSGKSELARQLSVRLLDSLKQDKRPVDVVLMRSESLASLMSSLIDAVLTLAKTVEKKTVEIKEIEKELEFRIADLFPSEGSTLKVEMKLKILFAKLKELFKERNSRPVLVFDNARDLKSLQKYIPLEAGGSHFTSFIVIVTLQKRVSTDRLSDFVHVIDLYDGMEEEDSIKLLELITGLLENEEEHAKELSEILGRQPLALTSASIYIESVRHGPPRNSSYHYSDYISEFKEDIDKLGKEEEIEWQESDAGKYASAMYVAVLKVVHLTAQNDPVFKDIACSVGVADISHLSLSVVLDFLESNADQEFSRAQIRTSLRNVLFKVGGEESDQILSSHQVIREAFRRVCKVSCCDPGWRDKTFSSLYMSRNKDYTETSALAEIFKRFSRTLERQLQFTVNMYVSVGEVRRHNHSLGFQFLDILTSLFIFSSKENLVLEEVVMSDSLSKMFLKYFSFAFGFWPGLIKPAYNEYRLKNLIELTEERSNDLNLRFDLNTVLFIICLNNGASKLYKDNLIVAMDKTSTGLKTYLQIQRQQGSPYGGMQSLLDILGVMYRSMGRPKTSRELHELSLEIFKEEDDSRVEDETNEDLHKERLLVKASILHKLGVIYRYQGNLSGALTCHEESLSLLEKLYDADHPFVAASLLNLAAVRNRAGEMSQALSTLLQARDVVEKTYGPQHPSVGKIENSIGAVYHKFSNFQKAIEHTTRGLEIQEAFYGSLHPHVAESLNFLGFMYRDRGHTEKAVECLEKSVRIKEKVFDANHFILGEALNDLGVAYTRSGRGAQAVPVLERALKIFEETWGTGHSAVGVALNSLGEAHCSLGDHELALTNHNRALDIFLGLSKGVEGHLEAETRGLLGRVYLAMGKRGKAELMLRSSYKTFSNIYDPEHKRVVDAKEILDKV